MTRISLLLLVTGLGLVGIALGCLAIGLGTRHPTKVEQALRPIAVATGALAVVMLTLYGLGRILLGGP